MIPLVVVAYVHSTSDVKSGNKNINVNKKLSYQEGPHDALY